MDLTLFKHALIGLPRNAKRFVIATSDALVLGVALWLAFALYFNRIAPAPAVEFWWGMVAIPLLSLPLLYSVRLYDSIIRYQGGQVVYSMLKGVTASAAMLAVIAWLVPSVTLAASIVVMYWFIAILFIGGSRFFMRAFLHSAGGRARRGKPVIIYGAGASGVQAALSLVSGPEYEPIAFLDDDPSLQNTLIQGICVYNPCELATLLKRFDVNSILLAMPSVGRAQKKAILTQLEDLPVHVKTLPGMAELVSGAALVDEIREVQIEDLLGRDPVAPQQSLLAACIADKVVMVTGAGGSIGSELARQIARVGPGKLVLFEVSEWALYQIERELQRAPGSLEIVPILGSVTDSALLEQVMQELQVQTVYHAAAYKHVPLVEHNLLGGIRNNVLGTWRTVEAALAAKVESFVLISTDKAVRPTNIMGASKRCAELVLQGIEQRVQAQGDVRTVVSMVRFGNVLGSSGSVVPLFREQINAGGPITVTHPEIIRYFMTTSEAANLVIQAGAMAKGGEVFVLDMGEPVRILDLAKRMIRLAGYDVLDESNPKGEIEIQFSGLRPGEKLYEELLIGEDVSGTSHSKIMQAKESYHTWDKLLPQLQKLERACGEFDCEAAKMLLTELVTEYSPADRIFDHLWTARSARMASQLAQPAAEISSKLQ